MVPHDDADPKMVSGINNKNNNQSTNSTSDSITEDFIKRRKIPPQNVILRLIKRETHASGRGIHWHVNRLFHQTVFPNFTVVNVEKPPCFLRKFSPDGQHFVAFSSDQTSIEIYEYQGAAAAGNLLQGYKEESWTIGTSATAATAFTGTGSGTVTIIEGASRTNGTTWTNNTSSGSTTSASLNIRSKIFECFFKLKHVVNVASNGEQLNRECSLFTNDGRFVIVGCAAYIAEDPPPLFYDMHRNNESVSPNPKYPLEDYSLHLVDLFHGKLCDSRSFKIDKIFLSHNQGLYLYKDVLAVLSVQQQTIHIFQVTSQGSFVDVRTIGRLCYEDDEFLLSSVSAAAATNPHSSSWRSPQQTLFRETSINSLKHRLLVFLYRKAVRDSHVEGSPKLLCKFFQYFENFCQLRMWKMQLLDENHLLIKYATENVVTLRTADPNTQPSFFVVYNMVTTQVLAVFENTSDSLLELFENFCDLFRNATLHCETQFPCSPSSNIHARLIQQRFKQTIISAKYGGPTEAVKRLLAQLPISSQSYSSSPYLDLALFSYDDKWVSVMERPKACGDHAIRFFARDSGLLKFKIYPGVLGRNPPPSARRLVAFTFHPYDPFAISVQRTNAEYVVNFHVRKVPSL